MQNANIQPQLCRLIISLQVQSVLTVLRAHRVRVLVIYMLLTLIHVGAGNWPSGPRALVQCSLVQWLTRLLIVGSDCQCQRARIVVCL